METTEPNVEGNPAHSKTLCLIMMFAVAVIDTVSAVLQPEVTPLSNLLHLSGGIMLNILLFAWCYYDAREKRFSLGAGWKIAIVLLGVLALIPYLFSSRGFLGGLKAVGLAIVLAITMLFAVTMIGVILEYLVAPASSY